MSDLQSCYLLDTSVILDDPLNILRISENNENIVAITLTKVPMHRERVKNMRMRKSR